MTERQKIFVFGSNTVGRHGAGAARHARLKWGAELGVGSGRTGNAYALPTKDHRLQTRHLENIQVSAWAFCDYAKEHPELDFIVTQVGCGLAGLKAADVAPMFGNAPSNCHFDEAWRPWLGDERTYWGHVE